MSRTKPTIFISHSKRDSSFISRLINDLRAAGVEIWYDEFEIAAGDSLRDTINHGLASADVVFAYVTDAALDSEWVTRELDAASVLDLEAPEGIFAIYVDSDATRAKLPLDLRRLRVPVMNADEYALPFAGLVSRAWSRFVATRERGEKLDEGKASEIPALKRQVERLSWYREILFDVVKLHARPPVFAAFGWRHLVHANGDGETISCATLMAVDVPISWWRLHLGASESAPGQDFDQLQFVARELPERRVLRSFPVRDEPHDKDIVVVFEQPILPGERRDVETRHMWNGTWETLIQTGSESSWFSIERPVDAVEIAFELPASATISSLDVAPQVRGAHVSITEKQARWQATSPPTGRYHWKLSVTIA